MIIETIIWILFVLMFTLMYVDLDDADQDAPTPQSKWGKALTPRYGGVPVVLNQMLAQARENQDSMGESEVHSLRITHFRNQRTEAQQAEFTAIGREAFLAKYSKNGELALKVTDTQNKMAALSPEENDALVVKILAEDKANSTPPPPPAKKKETI